MSSPAGSVMRSPAIESGAGLLFISHDLAVVRVIADRTLVMCRSKIVESGLTELVWNDPVHPYTKVGDPRSRPAGNPARRPRRGCSRGVARRAGRGARPVLGALFWAATGLSHRLVERVRDSRWRLCGIAPPAAAWIQPGWGLDLRHALQHSNLPSGCLDGSMMEPAQKNSVTG
jgi:hypothetical protein